ncbi:MAG: inositol monophosphatase [Verrucomicrobiae bacterium]|nr:inositol monophosphatase [Verrucomicrobiae bacterium]
MKTILTRDLKAAGKLLLRYFGRTLRVTRKESHASVVTQADVAVERFLVERIRACYPDQNILGEETGWQNLGSEFTWVIDPLDGTSNFAAGLPWFGVMLAVLRNAQPVMAAVYLPATDTLYFAEKGNGVFRNGQRVRVSTAKRLCDALCAFALDPTNDLQKARRNVAVFEQLVARCRNLRMTNCLVDFCSTVDGRIGVCLNQMTRIWDIAPFVLMFPEAGGVFTDQNGEPIRFDLEGDPLQAEYAVVGGNHRLHRQVVELIERLEG